jgi:hypothetical protein
MADPGVGIGGVGAADIVALGVHYDQNTGIDRGAAKPCKDMHPVRALRLEKGGLRLDGGNTSPSPFQGMPSRNPRWRAALMGWRSR